MALHLLGPTHVEGYRAYSFLAVIVRRKELFVVAGYPVVAGHQGARGFQTWRVLSGKGLESVVD